MSIAELLDATSQSWIRIRGLDPVIRSSHELPAGNWQLEGVSLEACHEIGECIAQLLPHAADITELSLSYSSARDADLAQLQKFPGLQRLDLAGCDDITDSGLARLSNLAHLADLTLKYCDGVTDAGISHLVGLPKLRTLDISGCEQLTRESLRSVATLTALTALRLDGMPCGNDGLRLLRPISGLRELSIENCGLTAEGLECLNDFAQLRKLTIGGVTEDGSQGWNLHRLKELTHLTITGSKAGDECLRFLCALDGLRDLFLGCCDSLAGEMFAYLSGIEDLSSLEVYKCDSIHGRAYSGLGKCGSLRRLTVHESEESVQGISDSGLSAVRRMKRLEELYLIGCHRLTNQALHHLSDCSSVRTLGIVDCLGITDEGVAPLRPLKSLVEVTLGVSGWTTHEDGSWSRLRRFTDECLEYIYDLPLLRSLCLESVDLRGVHTSLFQKMTSLRELDLKRASLDDRAAASIGTLTKLECLDLEHADISDAGVVALKSLTSLRFLYFPDCGISPDVRALLAKSLPDCDIRD